MKYYFAKSIRPSTVNEVRNGIYRKLETVEIEAENLEEAKRLMKIQNSKELEEYNKNTRDFGGYLP